MKISFQDFKKPSMIFKFLLYFVIFITYYLISSGFWIANEIEHYFDWFFIIPLLFLSYSILYHVLLLLGLTYKFDIYNKYDNYTYLILPLFPILMSLKPLFPNWFFWFGGFYLLILTIKTIILSRFLYYNIASSSENINLKKKFTIFLVFLVTYIFVTMWVCKTYPPDGDEPHYLILAHSLTYDQDFKTMNNYENEDYLEYYPYPSSRYSGSSSSHFHCLWCSRHACPYAKS